MHNMCINILIDVIVDSYNINILYYIRLSVTVDFDMIMCPTVVQTKKIH